MKTIFIDKHVTRILILQCFLAAAISLLIIISSKAFSRLTDYFTKEQFSSIPWKLIIFTCSVFFIQLFLYDFVYNEISSYLERRLFDQIHTNLLNSLCKKSLSDPTLLNMGDTYSSLVNDTEKTISLWAQIVPDAILKFLMIGIISLYLIFKNWVMFMIYGGLSLAALCLQKKLSEFMLSASQKAIQAEVDYNTTLNNVLKNRLITKCYNAYSFVSEIYNPQQKNYIQKNIDIAKVQFPLKTVGIILGLIPLVGISLYGLYAVPLKIVSLESFLTVYYICQYVMPYQTHLSDLIGDIRTCQIPMQRICRLISENENKECANQNDEFELKDVAFSYPNTQIPVLHDINLHIGKNEKIGIVGKSGSGKTTLLKLLACFIEPTKGSIKAPDVLYTQQFPHMFNDSVKANVVLNNHENSFPEAISNAGISQFVIEKGVDFILEEDAANLSGGQKQRIAIARTFCKHSKAYIFDESFSAMNADIAAEVMKNILQQKHNSTVIFSLHQPELLQYLDRIIRIDHGTITFDGSYQEYKKEVM